jgi:hypothetical protein
VRPVCPYCSEDLANQQWSYMHTHWGFREAHVLCHRMFGRLPLGWEKGQCLSCRKPLQNAKSHVCAECFAALHAGVRSA